MLTYGFLSRIWPFSEHVHIDGLESYITHVNADRWHLYAIKKRHTRPHVYIACNWLYNTLHKNAKIFETGCGSGINLLWLGQRGFINLQGADLSTSAVELSQLLSKKLDIIIDTWCDDSCHPQYLPNNIEGLLSVNWLYHCKGTSLAQFLSLYRPCIASNGKIAFDMVDSSYNQFRDNEYHTEDLTIPLHLRRPSEYKLRLSQDEIKKIVEEHGFNLLKFCKVKGRIPRTVWLVQKTN